MITPVPGLTRRDIAYTSAEPVAFIAEKMPICRAMRRLKALQTGILTRRVTKMKTICVYCGSRDGNDPAFAKAAEAIGAGIAGRGMSLIYGGGQVGLMGRVAGAALKGGAHVTGVIPHHLRSREVDRDDLSELITVDTMHERKTIMFERADAFIALPGGPGTLDELLEVLTWRQLGLHQKPAHLLNLNGYWEPLRALLAATVASGFASPEIDGFITPHATVEELIASL